MMNNVINRFVFALLVTLLLSCSMTQKKITIHSQEDIHRELKSLEGAKIKMDQDFQEMTFLQEKIKDPELVNSLQKLLPHKHEFHQKFLLLKKNINQVRLIAPQFQSIEKEFNQLKKCYLNYKEIREELKIKLESKNIYRLDLSRIHDDFLGAIHDGQLSVEDVKKNLMEAKLSHSQPMDQSFQTQLQKLSKMASRLEDEVFRLKRFYIAAIKEISDNKFNYSFAGLKIESHRVKIKKALELIEKKKNEFNQKLHSL